MWRKRLETNLIFSAIFNQSAEDVTDPRELSSNKKNLIIFDDCYLKNKTHVNRIMSEEDSNVDWF